MRKRTRLQLTLDPELADLLDRFSEITGSSKAGFVVAMLKAAVPSMETAVKAVELAKKDPIKSERLLKILAKEAEEQLKLIGEQ